jgi:hypothetical protein
MAKKGLSLPESAEKSRVLAACALKSVCQCSPLVSGFTWEKDERREKRIQLSAQAKKFEARGGSARPISREILILKERQQTQHCAPLRRNVFCSISCLLFFLQERTHTRAHRDGQSCDAGGRNIFYLLRFAVS